MQMRDVSRRADFDVLIAMQLRQMNCPNAFIRSDTRAAQRHPHFIEAYRLMTRQ